MAWVDRVVCSQRSSGKLLCNHLVRSIPRCGIETWPRLLGMGFGSCKCLLDSLQLEGRCRCSGHCGSRRGLSPHPAKKPISAIIYKAVLVYLAARSRANLSLVISGEVCGAQARRHVESRPTSRLGSARQCAWLRAEWRRAPSRNSPTGHCLELVDRAPSSRVACGGVTCAVPDLARPPAPHDAGGLSAPRSLRTCVTSEEHAYPESDLIQGGTRRPLCGLVHQRMHAAECTGACAPT